MWPFRLPFLWNPCHIALIWFLPRMHLEMSCKITIHWQSLVTLTALLCFYPECISNNLKITICLKYLGRLAALICSLPRVCSKMPYKMNILQNSLVTLVALIWYLPSMSSHIHVNEMMHWFGFSPECNLKCLVRLLFLDKV